MGTYRSRVSVILTTLLFCAPVGQGIATYLAGDFKLGATLTLFCIITAIVLVFCFGVKYVINGDKLEVRTLGMRQVSIDIHSITGFEENHNIVSAPAASFNRLWVCYGNGERVNISPRNQEQFIAEINAIRNAK